MADRERFVERDLRGARFVECDLSGVVMRGVDIAGMDIHAPSLRDGQGLRVNGVDVTPFVEQELDRRFPRRSEVLGLREADFHPLGLGDGSKESVAGSYDDVLAARGPGSDGA